MAWRGVRALHLRRPGGSPELEQRASPSFTGQEDAILYAAAFDANGGVFEPLLGPEDAIVSDALNHASIIDGVRLCKAKRYRYANSDMNDLEAQLKQARADGARTILIVTDGVFSMDGYIADLKSICDLADKYDALTMVDDCHAHGFMGAKGAARRSIAASWAGSTSSPARWARRWAARWAGSLRRKSR
jgi:7-keto-8-aminopelargonate synthetase-like enzyme